jgi:glucokinase
MGAYLFDLGGTYLRCTITDQDGNIGIIKKNHIPNFINSESTEVIWPKIIDDIAEYIEETESYIGLNDTVILAFPGPIQQPGIICGAATIAGSIETVPDILTLISERTNRQVFILNDISAATWRVSEITSVNRFIVVTVSSGIGSKIFDREHPMRVLDNVPYAGEIGHIIVDSSVEAMECDCGGKGHLGAIASGRGIERHAQKEALRCQDVFLSSRCVRDYGGTAETLTNENHIVPAAVKGDQWANNIIRDCTKPLASTLLTVTMALGLEKIFVIGGFALAMGELYRQMLIELMRSACDYPLLLNHIDGLVEIGIQKEEMCLEGAAVFYKQLLMTRAIKDAGGPHLSFP